VSPKETPLIVEFAKLALGIPPNVNVIESAPAFPTILNPAPEPDATVNVSDALSATTLTPLTDIVSNEFVPDTLVKYPASLFNCETLLPETTTFFHSAILFSLLFNINICVVLKSI
jgi:hypothetical protein